MKLKHILVTGGAGFIGSHLVDRFIKLGYKVTVFDNLSTGILKYVNPKATFVKGDVSDKRALKSLFKHGFDVVCHIAGCASAIKSFTNVENDIQTNFIGTVNIVTQCIEAKVSRLLYASSMTVYGSIYDLPIKESQSCKPISYYGISKYASERFVHATSERIDLKTPFHVTSFRMFNVYGPRQSLTNPYQGVMAIFIGNVLRNDPITIFGDGKQARDFVYIEDVIDIWIKAIDAKKSFGKVFNIGYGKKVAINTLVTTIIKACGKNPKTYPVYHKSQRPGDQRFMEADMTLFKQTFGQTPSTTLAKGLSSTIEWARQNK